MHRLGHCETYDKLQDIENGQVQKAMKLMNNSHAEALPLQSRSYENTVLTVYWADNRDKNVAKETGGGAVNIMVSKTIMVSKKCLIMLLVLNAKISVQKLGQGM